MDELELLKKDWKKSEDSYPKLSYNEIYPMLWKRSSSIVKWIFIISVLEFVLWTGLNIFLKDSKYNQKFKEYDADAIWIPFMVIVYAILFYYIYKFFINYKKISVVDNAKNLMEKILKTRKTVKHYVAFNLIAIVVSFFLVLGIQFKRDKDMISFQESAAADGNLLIFYASTIGIALVALVVMCLIILGFYYVIYGLLLGKLNRNYKELKKIEI